MNCQELAESLQRLDPNSTPTHIARLCLMLFNTVDDASVLESPRFLEEVWADVNLRFQGAADQHSAMTEELEELACSDPCKFSPEQIWILVRAIKVQSQVLKLYAGEATALS